MTPPKLSDGGTYLSIKILCEKLLIYRFPPFVVSWYVLEDIFEEYSTVFWELDSWYIRPVEPLSVLCRYERGVDHDWFHSDDSCDLVSVGFFHARHILQEKVSGFHFLEESHVFKEEPRLFSVQSFPSSLSNGEVLARGASYHDIYSRLFLGFVSRAIEPLEISEAVLDVFDVADMDHLWVVVLSDFDRIVIYL